MRPKAKDLYIIFIKNNKNEIKKYLVNYKPDQIEMGVDGYIAQDSVDCETAADLKETVEFFSILFENELNWMEPGYFYIDLRDEDLVGTLPKKVYLKYIENDPNVYAE